MRKRFTADMDLSEADMRAFLEIVAANSRNFTMHDIPSDYPPSSSKANGHAPAHRLHSLVYSKDMVVRIAPGTPSKLPPGEQRVYDTIRRRYGDTPFRKGDCSADLTREISTGASSVLTQLCRKGYLVPVEPKLL